MAVAVELDLQNEDPTLEVESTQPDLEKEILNRYEQKHEAKSWRKFSKMQATVEGVLATGSTVATGLSVTEIMGFPTTEAKIAGGLIFAAATIGFTRTAIGHIKKARHFRKDELWQQGMIDGFKEMRHKPLPPITCYDAPFPPMTKVG